jgi:hypothetical protein
MGNRLYVGNLSFQTSEDVLHQVFEQAGEVVEAKIVTDRATGRSRGFGFVTMGTAEAAQKAISEFDGTEVDGRTLRVNGGGGGGRGGFGGGGGGGYGGGGGGGGRGGRGGGGGGGGGRW